MLRLRLVDTVLGHDEVVFSLERAELLLGELAPLRADVLEEHLLALGRFPYARRCRIRGCGVHEYDLHNIDETSSEWVSFKQQPYMAMNRASHRGWKTPLQNKDWSRCLPLQQSYRTVSI
jgi:hypothetical protein